MSLGRNPCTLHLLACQVRVTVSCVTSFDHESTPFVCWLSRFRVCHARSKVFLVFMKLVHAVRRWLSGFGLDGRFLLMRFILKPRLAESFVDNNYRHLVANFVGRVAACMHGWPNCS